MESTVAALILSAGSSRRMGSPKALLRIGKHTFLQHLIHVICEAGLTNKIVILGHESETIRESLTSFDGIIIVNDEWERGQLSSIIAGIKNLDRTNCLGVLICPVDHPMISSELVKRLLAAFHQTKKKIIIPEYHGRKGHPIVISSELFPEINNASLEIGLREVVHAHKNDIELVSTEEEGVIVNIDTPEDYRRYFENIITDAP